MNRIVTSNFLYGECWPSGAWGVSTPDRRFLRVSRGGKFAAQDDDGRIVDAVGTVLLPRSCGVSPVIWRGEELVNNAGCLDGTQGYRYVRPDGSIATGDETYKHPTLPLWEYTDLGDGLLIGQGEDGAVFFDGTALRMLERGHCTFIRANREGDQVGISFARQKEVQNVRMVASLAELRALPPIAATTPPIQEPPPVPEPIGPVPIGAVPNEAEFAARFLRARLLRYAGDEERTRAHTFDIVNALCLALIDRTHDTRWKLLYKPGGPRDRAADVLLYVISPVGAQVVDVVGDAEGHDGMPTPAWQLKDVRHIDESRLPYLSGTDTPPVLVPGPLPAPTGKSVTVDLSAILAPIEAKLTAMQATIGRQEQAIAALQATAGAGGGGLPSRVALKSAHGFYIAVEQNGLVIGNRESIGPWETLTVEPVK